MPVVVSIEPFSSSIDMYDSPDSSAVYSLSGHIVISLTQSSSILGLSRPGPQSFVLTSLEVTFEGQSELILDDFGYAPLRLISLTKQLVSQPVPISADEDRAEWRVVFDLAIPGWLPATSIFGDDQQRSTGISYALYARARFLTDPDDVPSAIGKPSCRVWDNLCAAVRLGWNRPHDISAKRVPIAIARYVSPPSEGGEFPLATFSVQVTDAKTSTSIPHEILRTLQLHAIIPSRTSVGDENIPLVLRMHGSSGDNHLRLLSFEADVTEIETFHTIPSPSYSARFPLPPAAQQPPTRPLNFPHPIHSLYDLGFMDVLPSRKCIPRERSIVPSGANKHFFLCGADTHAPCGVPLEAAWIRTEVAIPVSIPEPAGESPFRALRHELRVRLQVGYEGERTLSDELAFSLPLEVVRPAPPHEVPSAAFYMHTSTMSLPLPHPEMSARAPSPALSLSALTTESRSAPKPMTPPALPAYSQLFYENGDRKYDGCALPLYREKEEGGSGSAPAIQDSPRSSHLPLTPSSPRTPSSPFTRDGPDSDSDSPLTPLVPPGLATCKRKFGESFLPFDDDEDEESIEEEETMQYGIAY